jgi:hypothetical protein
LNNAEYYVHYGDGFRRRLTRQAAMQSVVETFKSITMLHAIVLYRVNDCDDLMGYLSDLGGDIEIQVVDALESLPALEPGRVLAVTQSHVDRAELVIRGFPPGLVLKLEDLFQQFTL